MTHHVKPLMHCRCARSTIFISTNTGHYQQGFHRGSFPCLNHLIISETRQGISKYSPPIRSFQQDLKIMSQLLSSCLVLRFNSNTKSSLMALTHPDSFLSFFKQDWVKGGVQRERAGRKERQDTRVTTLSKHSHCPVEEKISLLGSVARQP